MKKQHLILFALLLMANFTNAQMSTIFGGGYNFNFGQSVGMNDLVERYNVRNLTEPMETFSPNGFTIGLISRDNTNPQPIYESLAFSTDAPFNYFEIGYSTFGEKNRAVFTGTNEDIYQELKMRMHGVYLGGGSSQFSLGVPIAAGFRMNVGQLKISNRQGEVSLIEEREWNEAYSNLFVDMSLNMKFFLGGFVIEPYYSFGFDGVFEWEIFDGANGSDITPVYEALGVGTVTAETNLKMRGFGLRLFLGFGGSVD